MKWRERAKVPIDTIHQSINQSIYHYLKCPCDAFEAACRHAGSNCPHGYAISILRRSRLEGIASSYLSKPDVGSCNASYVGEVLLVPRLRTDQMPNLCTRRAFQGQRCKHTCTFDAGFVSRLFDHLAWRRQGHLHSLSRGSAVEADDH